jgi:hypothetical protein
MTDVAEALIAHGGAAIADRHLLAAVIAVDDGIIRVIERRERRRQRRTKIEEPACT